MNAKKSVVRGDATQMQNCFLNIGLNARDAMPDGGVITLTTIDTTLTEEDCKGKKVDIIPGRYVRIDIEDTGIGMDEKTQERIFEPFFTTKVIGKGPGLGLASAYGAVKEQGGTILVSSKLGKGTKFSIYLPAVDERIDYKTEEISDDIIKGEGRILVVDDERIVQKMATIILKKMGYDVEVAKDGEEAVNIYKEKHEEFDLVLLDIVMPKKNGYDTFFELKAIDPDVKVIICSGFSRDKNVTELLENGAMDFIQKPFRSHDMSKKIATAMQA